MRFGKTHGHARSKTKPASPTYRSWQGTHDRCTNRFAYYYHRYGGRGIKVCGRWDLFENFLADMGERPAGMTLDRYPDKDGDYEPENCRWATWEQQQNNTSKNCFLEIDGCLKTVAEWSRISGIKRITIYKRVNRGLSAKGAVFGPVVRGRPRKVKCI